VSPVAGRDPPDVTPLGYNGIMSADDLLLDEANASLDLEPGDDALIEQITPCSRSRAPAVALPRHLSPSSAALFEQCPRRWRLRYVDKVTEPVGEEALVGTFAHRVLELLLAEPRHRRTQDRAKAIARTVWPDTEGHPDYQALGLDAAASRAFRWKGWLAVSGLWQNEDPAPSTWPPPSATSPPSSTGSRSSAWSIASTAAPTAWSSPTTSRVAPVAPVRTRQAHPGAALCRGGGASDGQAPVRARLVYLGNARSRPRHPRRRSDRGRRAASDLGRPRRSQAVPTTFDPAPGPLCGWCPFADQCDEGLVELRRRHDQGRLRHDAPAAALVA
jgi:putative RecB family exonuclease